MAKAVIATIGEDRPGLVNELSQLVLETGLNIEDSRMSVLGGEFAVLMSVSGKDAALASLQDELAKLSESSGLVYLFRRTQERSRTAHAISVVTIETVDHPGIVHGIARFFSDRGINVRELETQISPGAHTGTPVFNVRMEIESQFDQNGALFKAFESFCAEEGLDGALLPA